MNSLAAAAGVTLSVSDRVVHRMKSGVGASWHSLLRPTVSHGGSAFGGTPPVTAAHEGLWRSLERQAAWLGLKFIRAEMDWRQWQPQRGVFTWTSPEMQILDRILRWAQQHGSDVMLQCMWLDVEWLAFPAYRDDPAKVQTSAPSDLEALAESWVLLLRELVQRRGYTCIKWITLVNEPNHYWWLVPPDIPETQDRLRQARHLGAALARVREALIVAQLPVKIMGPDYTDLPVLPRLAGEPWWPHVDDVDFHSYCSCFDWEDPAAQPAVGAYRLGTRLKETLQPYRAETAAAGKGLFLTEFGTQTYGYKADDPAPGSFKASLKDTELLIRALNLGVDGLNHWSFTNRGDCDGQWQLVDTWDRQWKQWLPECVPHRDAYHVLGLAMRHVPHRAGVLATFEEGGRVQDGPRVWTAAVCSPSDSSVTVLIVNDADQPWTATVAGPVFDRPLWQLNSVAGAAPQETLRYASLPCRAGKATCLLPAFSLTVLTDTPLEPEAAGRW
ncbi:MAG: hypothetical protein HYV95_05325 [Opitutae bacterium]|nr:hypothetical protein [Opitutae bacterium]